jgi:hypothetical protein
MAPTGSQGRRIDQRHFADIVLFGCTAYGQSHLSVPDSYARV